MYGVGEVHHVLGREPVGDLIAGSEASQSEGRGVGDPLCQLQRHRLRDELGVELRLEDLLDVDEDLLAGLLLDLLLELVDLLTLPGSVVVPAGTSTADIVVDPIVDAAAESPVTVTITLAPGAGYLVDLASSTTTVTITD